MFEDRILVVDDDLSWQALLLESIEGISRPGLPPCAPRVVGSYAEADALLDRQHFHLAFVDLRLREEARELEGKKLVQKIVELDEGTSVVIATGHADVSTAITALKEWKVLDFILKDAWDPGKVAHLVKIGIPLARERYRLRFESAIECLRGEQSIYAWVARVLEAVSAERDASGAERRLGDFLNGLMEGLYPVLPHRQDQGARIDAASRVVSARFWSKALGRAIEVRFGARQAIDGATEALEPILRTAADEALGIVGVVAGPAAPSFEEYVRA